MDEFISYFFAILFISIILIAVCAAIANFRYHKQIQKEIEAFHEQVKAFKKQIDYTDLMAATDNESTYRIHYKDGTTRVVAAEKKTPLYNACFQKLV